MALPSAALPSSDELRDQVLTWLTDWFAAKGKVSAHSASIAEVDYFEAGWMTSMEVVEFVTAIENHFDMQFSDQDMHDPRFATVAGLADLILHNPAFAGKP